MTHDMAGQVESARTKADHEALAAHYEQEAKELQDKAARHERTAKAYARDPYRASGPRSRPTPPPSPFQHCEALASSYRKAAAENLELAKVHRQLAEEAPK
jgi:hypothetical protein